MKNKYFFLLIALFLYSAKGMALFPIDSLSGGGNGTEQNPYQIITSFDLYSFRDAINNSGGAGVATAYYELGGDIDLTGVDWSVPIGNSTNCFKGRFNGNGFKIIGLNSGAVEIPNTTSPALGLFGSIEGAAITNLQVEVKFHYYKSSNRSGLYTFGGLVSTVESGINVIDNCKVSGIINATRAGTNNTLPLRVGGLVGLVNGSATLQISNCNSNVQLIVLNTVTTTSNGGAYCGGIIGEAVTGSVVDVVNSYAVGSIKARSTNFNTYAGGIIGTRQGAIGSLKIYNCYASNTIDAYGYISTYVGGIVGNCSNLATLEIMNCIALNPHIYAYNTNQLTTIPYVNRIVSSINSSSNLKLSDNNALGVMEIKGWKNWNGTIGDESNPTITNSAVGVHGASLNSVDYIEQTSTKLNNYVASNPYYLNFKLNMWIKDKNVYPEFINKKYFLLSDNYSLNNMDIKSFKNWNGESGVQTSLSINNNMSGNLLSSINPIEQTLNNQNNYVSLTMNPGLLSWEINKESGYPHFFSIVSGFAPDNLVDKNTNKNLRYFVNDQNLILSVYGEAGFLQIFNALGMQFFANKVKGDSMIPLPEGIYILLFKGKFHSKFIVN